MSQRQLERLEDQNRVFDSDSMSSESESAEESKKRMSSFEDSQRRSADNSTDADNTKSNTNTTAKSGDSAIESSGVRALQESLERFSGLQDSDGNRVRQELL